MGTGSDLTDPTGSRLVNRPFCMGKPENGPPNRCQILASICRRGRGGPPRPRRTPQIATEPPNIPHRPLRTGGARRRGRWGFPRAVCGVGRSQWRARRGGCPAGRGRPSSPWRGRQCAPRGGRTRTPYGVRSRTAIVPDMPRVPRPCARPRRAPPWRRPSRYVFFCCCTWSRRLRAPGSLFRLSRLKHTFPSLQLRKHVIVLK